MEQGGREALAIVGIGCRFPGGAHSVEAFWNSLCGETDATCVVPETRWDAGRYFDPNPAKVGKMVTFRGGFLNQIDQFDPQFFGISPREANLLDPQQRLLLETTWEALEDGGIPADALAGTDVGVFVGGFTLDYQLLQNQGRTSRYRLKTHSATGMMMTMLANRISFTFDFRGPSMTVDTACSSSLVAVHLAAQSIWNGECHLAVAGGVNIMIGPNTAIAESKSGFLSPEGRCKAFDVSADGYARGEGGAVVVIKPLGRALADGDEIYAQILGTAVSQDGRTEGITVPSEDAQHAAISTALARAGLSANDIGYVEAHGTGTPVGDPIELRALANALAADRPESDPLLVGSVKANIGHLEAAAGVAGLIKAALVLKHGYVPAQLHLKNPLRTTNIVIPQTGRPFAEGIRRVAGVNSFGFGGTNAHVVLAQPPTPVGNADGTPGRPLVILPISARSGEALTETVQQLASHLGEHPDVTLADLGYTLGRRRSHLNHRRAIVAGSLDEARDQLRALAEGGQISPSRPHPASPKLAFVCSGMGPQWWKMCRGLLDIYPAFADSIQRTDRELSRYTHWSLLDELRADETRSRMAETEVAQPANFAVQVALAAQLAQFGIRPHAVIGHSAGEVAAHHLAGLLTFEQAVQVVYHRSRLQQQTSGLGRMLAVGIGADALMQNLDDKAFDQIGRRVSIAAINSPSAVTLAGDSDVLEDIARQLGEAEIFNRFLTGKVPYHTHYMEAVKEDLCRSLDGLSSGTAAIPLYSTVTGEQLGGYTAGAAYWWQNTRATVLFEAAARRMIEDGYAHFVELGPHPVLAPSIIELAGTQEAERNTEVVVLPAQRRDDDDSRTLMNCVGALYCHGHQIDWDTMYPRAGARLLKLPSYPWQSKRFWNETQEAAEELHYRPVHPLLGQPVSAVHPTWEVELSTAAMPFLEDHQVQGSILVPGAVFVEMALAAAKATYGSTDHSVDNLVLHRALILDGTCDPLLRTTLHQDTGALEFAAFTATADGDLNWTITATAELNTLSRPIRCTVDDSQPLGAISGADFYAHTRTIGFGYGDMFQTVREITAGHGWAVAQLEVPERLAAELGAHRFHPALIDGAFQTLFGARLLDQDQDQETYLPTRIRRSSIFHAPDPNMIVRARVVSATREEIESDITISSQAGKTLATFDGFTVRSLSAASGMSWDQLDKGLYEVVWIAEPARNQDQVPETACSADSSWLILADTSGIGAAVAERLRRCGHRAHLVEHQPVNALAEIDGGYALNPRQAEQLRRLLDLHLERERGLAGVVDCWPLDITSDDATETAHHIGVFTVLRLVKAFADNGAVRPRLHLITGNAQPAPGTESIVADQATIWGLGRVIGHQEFVDYWGGLIDIEPDADTAETAAQICEHVLAGQSEDQIAIRSGQTFVARLRRSGNLTRPFPTKLSPDATYVVTGGSGALGRIVAGYLAERGARHIALLSRSKIPQRSQWSRQTKDDPHCATVDALRRIEHLGARITTASVDITDADQVRAWVDDHNRDGGQPVRGVVHAAGTVNDQLLVNMSEADFAAVLAVKTTGARILHDVFGGQELEFFVMFGSAGSVIAAPGQGNYAAANAFLDAFAHYRHAQGLPALTIGWGPWSVGMVEELKLEKLYRRRGIELITPAAGTRILDRLINQKTASVVAISADWTLARRAGLSGQLPPMFSELGTAAFSAESDAETSILQALSRCAEAERQEVVASHVRRILGAVFEVPAADIGSDDILNDIGMDSMMAMDFRTRVNATFGIDLPVLEILRGVSVSSLAMQILSSLNLGCAELPVAERSEFAGDDIDSMMEQLSNIELRELLAELESLSAEQDTGGAQQ
ncbi:type I polyketide synthase [Mycobacterium vicinigordonae]